MHLNESIETAQAILLRTEAIHPKVAMVAFNPCLSRERHGLEAKERLRYAIDLDKDIHPVALDDEDLKPRGIGWVSPRKSSTWSRFSKR
jgi:hypothetical protein